MADNKEMAENEGSEMGNDMQQKDQGHGSS